MAKKKKPNSGVRIRSVGGQVRIEYKRTESPEMEFAERLRNAMRQSGLSQNQVAKETGIPQGAISMFMTGGDLRMKTFGRLASFLGLELRPRVTQRGPKESV